MDLKDTNKEPFNVAEFLKNAPYMGFKLWNARTENYVTFRSVEYKDIDSDPKPVILTRTEDDLVCFDKYGRALSCFYGEIYSEDVSLFPNETNLFWQTENSPNLAAEILFPQCTGSVIIDGEGDPLIVGAEEYYYFNAKEYYYFNKAEDKPFIVQCRFHKLNYNNARFATTEETATFYDNLANNGYKFDDGCVKMIKEEPKQRVMNFKEFQFPDDLCDWVNSNQDSIEVVSIVPVTSKFNPNNYYLFYFTKV